MRVIKGFEKARAALVRRSPLGLGELSHGARERMREVFGKELSPLEAVRRILDDIRTQGDAALLRYTRLIDGVELKGLEVSGEERKRAMGKVDGGLLEAMKVAVERVRSFHLLQRRGDWFDREKGLGELVRPLKRAGIYMPGGTAVYFSTALMTAIPAKVAGVGEIIMCTPPGKGGEVSPSMLAAAEIAGVERIFKVGGAQAIGAMAYGTESVPRVDKIFGPGNVFVMLAKKEVFGYVGIDSLAGPTEAIIVADESADPVLVASDLLAQAEHDVLASAILITTSPKLASEVKKELKHQLIGMERREIAEESFRKMGFIAVVENLEEAVELVNLYAPEHLSLFVEDARSYLGRIRNAGAIFLGEGSPNVLGDYVAGPSHVLPTGGAARFSSGLRVDDFLKSISVVALDQKAMQEIGPVAAKLARAEGLTGHARSAELRLSARRSRGLRNR